MLKKIQNSLLFVISLFGAETMEAQTLKNGRLTLNEETHEIPITIFSAGGVSVRDLQVRR